MIKAKNTKQKILQEQKYKIKFNKTKIEKYKSKRRK